MNKENQTSVMAQESRAKELTAKKPFVEPEMSDPVDVLESTNFFQAVTGTTDPAVP